MTPDEKRTEAYQKLQTAHVTFEAKIAELRKRRIEWMEKVVARIEKEKIEAVRASFKE